jgi:ribosomal protein S27AE
MAKKATGLLMRCVECGQVVDMVIHTADWSVECGECGEAVDPIDAAERLEADAARWRRFAAWLATATKNV